MSIVVCQHRHNAVCSIRTVTGAFTGCTFDSSTRISLTCKYMGKKTMGLFPQQQADTIQNMISAALLEQHIRIRRAPSAHPLPNTRSV
jgi:hypothetical protein